MNLSDVDALLADYGVRPGNRDSRRELALRLSRTSMTEAAMARLYRHAQQHSRGGASKLLASILDGDWFELLEDLRRFDAKEEDRTAAARGSSVPAHYDKGTQETQEQQARANGQTLDEYHAERDQRHALDLVAFGRRQVDEAAREMGWTVEQVCAAIDRWAPGAGLDPQWLRTRDTREALSPEQQKEAARRHREERRLEVAKVEGEAAPLLDVSDATREAIRKRDAKELAKLDSGFQRKHADGLRAAGINLNERRKP